MRSLIISNTSSGGSKSDLARRIRMVFDRLGESTHLEPPSLDSFDEDVQRAAQDKDLVVIAGGDGTLNCALNALKERLSDIALAVVPMGTGNDFARTLGLPQDPLEAAEAIASGVEREIDYGRARSAARSRLFVNACMGGFPVEVNEAIDEDTKKRLGPLAFWVGGAKAAARFPQFRVEVEGEEVPDVVAIGIGNGRTAGGGIPVFPEADPSDGQLECCVMQVSGVLEGAEMAAKVRSGAHVSLDNVRNRRAPRMEVRARPELEFNVDGDLFDLTTPVTFEIVGRLRLRVPDRATKDGA